MAVHLERVPPAGEQVPAPLNPDGNPFFYCMIYNGDQDMAFADTATELVGLLIAGYMDIPDHDLVAQTRERVLAAVGVQVRTQAAILGDMDQPGADITPTERTILLASRDTPPAVNVWECPVPLVLVEAFYAPITDLPRPIGRPRDGGPQDDNLIWIETDDEDTFLWSLHRCGAIQLGTNDILDGR